MDKKLAEAHVHSIASKLGTRRDVSDLEAVARRPVAVAAPRSISLCVGDTHPPEHDDGGSDDADDAELMQRVRSGDSAAFDRIVHLHWRRAVVYARYLVRDHESAADYAQEAFARLWRKKDEWEPTGSVGVWLLRTIRNLVISEQRKRDVRRRWALRADHEEPQPTPLQDAERAELRAAMRHAIEQLSPRRREVFVLFHLQNLSYGEIAELMNIRRQTVGNYLQAAIAQLRVGLAAFYPTLSQEEDRPSRGSGERAE